MPIYEYRCNACEQEFEKLQKISDPVLTDCPQCHKSELVKMVSASSFRLKGSGWYETDFKTGNKKNGVGSADKAESSGSEKSSSDSKSDSDTKSSAASNETAKNTGSSKAASSK